jgi:hypothetical protein
MIAGSCPTVVAHQIPFLIVQQDITSSLAHNVVETVEALCFVDEKSRKRFSLAFNLCDNASRRSLMNFDSDVRPNVDNPREYANGGATMLADVDLVIIPMPRVAMADLSVDRGPRRGRQRQSVSPSDGNG